MSNEKDRTGVSPVVAPITFNVGSVDFWLNALLLIFGVFNLIDTGILAGANPGQLAEDALAAFRSANWVQITGFIFTAGLGIFVRTARAIKEKDKDFWLSTNLWTYVFTGVFGIAGLFWSPAVALGAAFVPPLVNMFLRWLRSRQQATA